MDKGWPLLMSYAAVLEGRNHLAYSPGGSFCLVLADFNMLIEIVLVNERQLLTLEL
jgi:hypothetical protein